jgi:aryl-alcohol dehydrogenase-like predicted oxidoreductase
MIALLLSFISLAAPLQAFSMQMSMSGISQNDRIVFGTAAISAAKNPFKVLDAAYEKGVRRFDLARTYGQGKSEIVFGEWLESR